MICYLNQRFRRNVRVTGSFFLLRFIVALLVGVLYIVIAAFIQDIFVRILGESSFNYIVGGLLSLFLGVIFCYYVGALFFMFIKGWHVAALAYVPKIVKSGAPAFNVGVKAFNRNLVSFGAVYGVRALLNSVLRKFKDKLWELSEDIPYANLFKRFADNPIVEYIASDVLHYAFDATVFYLVRHSPKDLDEVPATVLTAVKKYLYCIPSILLSSVQSYIFFRFIPKLLKWCLIVWVLFTQGLVAGILITVLMVPAFYILDNAFFDPLTMIVFISAYAKVCDKEVDEGSPIIHAVNAIIDFDEDGNEAEEIALTMEDEEEEPKPKKKKAVKKEPVAQEPMLPSDEELFGGSGDDVVVPDEPAGLPSQTIGSLADLARAAPSGMVNFRRADPSTQVEDVTQPLPEDTAEPKIDFTRAEEEVVEIEEVQDVPQFRSGSGLASLFGGLSFDDLDGDPLGGDYIQEEHTDRAQSFLSGNEE